jgi:negative regulator of sigma E activity
LPTRLNIACDAVLGVCVAVKQIPGGTATHELLNNPVAEYEAMKGTAKAEDSKAAAERIRRGLSDN